PRPRRTGAARSPARRQRDHRRRAQGDERGDSSLPSAGWGTARHPRAGAGGSVVHAFPFAAVSSTPVTTAPLAYRIAPTHGRVYDWSSLIVNTFFGLQSNVFACFAETRMVLVRLRFLG